MTYAAVNASELHLEGRLRYEVQMEWTSITQLSSRSGSAFWQVTELGACTCRAHEMHLCTSPCACLVNSILEQQFHLKN